MRAVVDSGAITYGGILKEIGLQADTVVKNAADQITFGQGNKIAAGLDTAAMMAVNPRLRTDREAVAQAYQQRLQVYNDRDAYDRRHRRGAQVTGQIGGGVVSVIGGPEVAALKGLSTASQAARAARNGRQVAAATKQARAAIAELVGPKQIAAATRDATAAAALGGAGSAVLGQAAADAVEGEFHPSEYIGAAFGGGLDGAASKYLGASVGGFTGGAGEAAVAAILNGEPIQLDEILRNGATASLGGRAGRAIGLDRVNRMTSNEKGELGEMMSFWNSVARGDIPLSHHGGLPQEISDLMKEKLPVDGGHSIPDQFLKDGRVVEAKMGQHARLSPRQRQLQAELGADFLYDHWQPQHFANAVGVAGSSAATAGQQLLAKEPSGESLEGRLLRPYRRPDSWFLFQ